MGLGLIYLLIFEICVWSVICLLFFDIYLLFGFCYLIFAYCCCFSTWGYYADKILAFYID